MLHAVAIHIFHLMKTNLTLNARIVTESIYLIENAMKEISPNFFTGSDDDYKIPIV